MASLQAALALSLPAGPLLKPPHAPVQAFAYPLPDPKPTLPTPVPDDPLSDKAEVKAVAEPTSTYGPLLDALRVSRVQLNQVLTDWKLWEDEISQGVDKNRKEEDDRGEDEEEES